MEHYPNQNAFTWKKMKLTVCFTAQYKSVIMMDFKVKEGAENTLIPSTVGSSILMKNPIQKASLLRWRTQFKIKQVKPQSMLVSYFHRFHHRVTSAKYLRMVDQKWQWLQGRSHSSINSDKMLEVSEIFLQRRERVDF